MQTRRDQLQAYRFLNRRALAALVTGEPNAVDPPMRRLTLTTVSGIMIAALVVAGFAMLGLIHPSVGDSWKDPGSIIVERETGARYVLIGGELHPVLNFSSAVLAVTAKSQAAAKVVLVNRSDLKSTKRGGPIGIDGIPDSLPSSGSLVTSPWSACSRQVPTDQGNITATVTLYVGSDPASIKVPSESWVIAKSVDGKHTYLLWHSMRLEINTGENVDRALNVQTATPVVVGTAFLDAVPEGTPLRTPTVPQLGTSGPQLNGQPTTVGQLLQDSQTSQFYVVLPHGFASVNTVQAALLRTLAVGSNNNALQLRKIDDTAALNLPTSPAEAKALLDQFAGLPTSVPAIDTQAGQNSGLCAVYRGSDTAPTFEVPPNLLTDAGTGSPTESDESLHGIADSVQLSPGRAAIVGSPNGSSTVFVVADPGKRYAAASVQALTGFGYGSVQPVTLPVGLVQMIAAGPALDATAALEPPAG